MALLLNTTSVVLALIGMGGLGTPMAMGAANANGAATDLRYTKVEEIPAALRGGMEAFGRMLEGEMKKAPQDRAEVRVDFRAVTEELFQDYPGVPAGLQQNLRLAVSGASDESTKEFWRPWNEGTLTFKGVVLFEGRPAVRLRGEQVKTGTVQFHELVLAQGRDGKSFRVTEMYNQTSGVAAARLLREDLVTVLAKAVVGQRPPEGERQLQAGALMDSFHDRCDKGQWREAAELFFTFPETVQATPHYAIACAKAAQKSGDKELFRRAAKKLSAVLKDGQGMLMLAQLYEAQEDFDDAAVCLDKYMKQIGAGTDAALTVKKAYLLERQGDTVNAVALVKEAIQLEPESAFVHTLGLPVLLAGKDHAGVRDSLAALDKAGALDAALKEAVRTEEKWAAFKAAPEGEAWR